MRRTLTLLALACGLLALAACARPTAEPAPTPAATATAARFSTNPYCPSGQPLCAALPGAQILVPPGCASSDQQCSRDFWSWQGFVSLNWPGKVVDGPGGVPVVEPDPAKTVGEDGSRVWELGMDPDSVFLPNAVQPAWNPGASPPLPCTTATAGRKLVGRLAKAAVAFGGGVDPDDFFEATIQQPLIDQSLEFVVFEIRMNQQEVGWVVSNGLYRQQTVQGLTSDLTFPPDAIEAKAAWRILPDTMPPTQKDRYYHEQATIVLDPAHVEGGGKSPVCLTRELGLIGLHLRHNGLWATFEQVDDVTPSSGISPTLNNPGCTTCTVNVPPTDPSGKPIPTDAYKWSLQGASASLYKGYPNVPAQITRAPGQEQWINTAMNTWWQQSVLPGTVWSHYMLITTNWIEFPTASQPIPALNTSLEPYLPPVTKLPQACIDCHKLAVNGKGAALGMSFLPFRACPAPSQPGQKLPPNCVIGKVGTLAAHR